MFELIIAAALFGVTADAEQPAPQAPATTPAAERRKANPGQTTPWTMPSLDYNGSDCEQFMQRSLDGFGNLKVGTPCPAKPAVAASKGRSVDQRN